MHMHISTYESGVEERERDGQMLGCREEEEGILSQSRFGRSRIYGHEFI